MPNIPPEVMAHPVDPTWQTIFTVASWAIVVVMFVIAISMGRRERTPFYVVALIAVGVAAFAEPIYDVIFDLWFYDADAAGNPGAAWSHFAAHGIVQPNWTHSGYIILYGSAALYIGRRMFEGRLTRRGLFGVWGLEILSSCVFETIGTGTGVYTYYGSYVLRIWNYPLVIGVLEGTQTLIFTVVAVLVWRNVRSAWGLLSLLAVFPMTFFAANVGLGAPVIVAMHLNEPFHSVGLIWVATLLTMALCAFAVYGASRFLPRPLGAPEVETVDAPDHRPLGVTRRRDGVSSQL